MGTYYDIQYKLDCLNHWFMADLSMTAMTSKEFMEGSWNAVCGRPFEGKTYRLLKYSNFFDLLSKKKVVKEFRPDG